MAASNYKPSPGYIKVVSPNPNFTRKFNLSTNQRVFPPGCPMWLNKVAGRYQAEPSLLTCQQATVNVSSATADADSGFATLLLANAPFAPLFLGFAAEGRIAPQMANLGSFSQAGPTPIANIVDASKPFISIHDRGIGICPVGPTLGTLGKLTVRLDVGQLLQVDGFANEAASGFYDPAGRHCVAGVGYFLFMNSLTTCGTAADAIAWLVEPAEVGQDFLKFEFRSAMNEYYYALYK
jgi:hypothetical protein